MRASFPFLGSQVAAGGGCPPLVCIRWMLVTPANTPWPAWPVATTNSHGIESASGDSTRATALPVTSLPSLWRLECPLWLAARGSPADVDLRARGERPQHHVLAGRGLDRLGDLRAVHRLGLCQRSQSKQDAQGRRAHQRQSRDHGLNSSRIDRSTARTCVVSAPTET